MVNCDPSSLAATATCWAQCIPDGQQMAVQSYLLAQIANNLNSAIPTDAQSLAKAAAGFTTLFGFEAPVQLFLLCSIAQAVGA